MAMQAGGNPVQYTDLQPHEAKYRTALQIIHNSFLDKSYQSSWHVQSLRMVRNNQLYSLYQAKAGDLHRLGSDTKEHDMFTCYKTMDLIHSIVERGLQTRQSSFNFLGDSRRGVNLCKHADIQLKAAENTGQEECYLIMYKVMLGKSLPLYPSPDNQKLAPMENFDSHVSSLAVDKNIPLGQQAIRSQVYCYEYMQGQLLSCPRHVLPYVVVCYKRNHTNSLPPALSMPVPNVQHPHQQVPQRSSVQPPPPPLVQMAPAPGSTHIPRHFQPRTETQIQSQDPASFQPRLPPKNPFVSQTLPQGIPVSLAPGMPPVMPHLQNFQPDPRLSYLNHRSPMSIPSMNPPESASVMMGMASALRPGYPLGRETTQIPLVPQATIQGRGMRLPYITPSPEPVNSQPNFNPPVRPQLLPSANVHSVVPQLPAPGMMHSSRTDNNSIMYTSVASTQSQPPPMISVQSSRTESRTGMSIPLQVLASVPVTTHTSSSTPIGMRLPIVIQPEESETELERAASHRPSSVPQSNHMRLPMVIQEPTTRSPTPVSTTFSTSQSISHTSAEQYPEDVKPVISRRKQVLISREPIIIDEEEDIEDSNSLTSRSSASTPAEPFVIAPQPVESEGITESIALDLRSSKETSHKTESANNKMSSPGRGTEDKLVIDEQSAMDETPSTSISDRRTSSQLSVIDDGSNQADRTPQDPAASAQFTSKIGPLLVNDNLKEVSSQENLSTVPEPTPVLEKVTQNGTKSPLDITPCKDFRLKKSRLSTSKERESTSLNMINPEADEYDDILPDLPPLDEKTSNGVLADKKTCLTATSKNINSEKMAQVDKVVKPKEKTTKKKKRPRDPFLATKPKKKRKLANKTNKNMNQKTTPFISAYPAVYYKENILQENPVFRICRDGSVDFYIDLYQEPQKENKTRDDLLNELGPPRTLIELEEDIPEFEESEWEEIGEVEIIHLGKKRTMNGNGATKNPNEIQTPEQVDEPLSPPVEAYHEFNNVYSPSPMQDEIMDDDHIHNNVHDNCQLPSSNGSENVTCENIEKSNELMSHSAEEDNDDAQSEDGAMTLQIACVQSLPHDDALNQFNMTEEHEEAISVDDKQRLTVPDNTENQDENTNDTDLLEQERVQLLSKLQELEDEGESNDTGREESPSLDSKGILKSSVHSKVRNTKKRKNRLSLKRSTDIKSKQDEKKDKLSDSEEESTVADPCSKSSSKRNHKTDDSDSDEERLRKDRRLVPPSNQGISKGSNSSDTTNKPKNNADTKGAACETNQLRKDVCKELSIKLSDIQVRRRSPRGKKVCDDDKESEDVPVRGRKKLRSKPRNYPEQEDDIPEQEERDLPREKISKKSPVKRTVVTKRNKLSGSLDRSVTPPRCRNRKQSRSPARSRSPRGRTRNRTPSPSRSRSRSKDRRFKRNRSSSRERSQSYDRENSRTYSGERSKDRSEKVRHKRVNRLAGSPSRSPTSESETDSRRASRERAERRSSLRNRKSPPRYGSNDEKSHISAKDLSTTDQVKENERISKSSEKPIEELRKDEASPKKGKIKKHKKKSKKMKSDKKFDNQSDGENSTVPEENSQRKGSDSKDPNSKTDDITESKTESGQEKKPPKIDSTTWIETCEKLYTGKQLGKDDAPLFDGYSAENDNTVKSSCDPSQWLNTLIRINQKGKCSSDNSQKTPITLENEESSGVQISHPAEVEQILRNVETEPFVSEQQTTIEKPVSEPVADPGTQITKTGKVLRKRVSSGNRSDTSPRRPVTVETPASAKTTKDMTKEELSELVSKVLQVFPQMQNTPSATPNANNQQESKQQSPEIQKSKPPIPPMIKNISGQSPVYATQPISSLCSLPKQNTAYENAYGRNQNIPKNQPIPHLLSHAEQSTKYASAYGKNPNIPRNQNPQYWRQNSGDGQYRQAHGSRNVAANQMQTQITSNIPPNITPLVPPPIPRLMDLNPHGQNVVTSVMAATAMAAAAIDSGLLSMAQTSLIQAGPSVITSQTSTLAMSRDPRLRKTISNSPQNQRDGHEHGSGSRSGNLSFPGMGTIGLERSQSVDDEGEVAKESRSKISKSWEASLSTPKALGSESVAFRQLKDLAKRKDTLTASAQMRRPSCSEHKLVESDLPIGDKIPWPYTVQPIDVDLGTCYSKMAEFTDSTKDPRVKAKPKDCVAQMEEQFGKQLARYCRKIPLDVVQKPVKADEPIKDTKEPAVKEPIKDMKEPAVKELIKDTKEPAVKEPSEIKSPIFVDTQIRKNQSEAADSDYEGCILSPPPEEPGMKIPGLGKFTDQPAEKLITWEDGELLSPKWDSQNKGKKVGDMWSACLKQNSSPGKDSFDMHLSPEVNIGKVDEGVRNSMMQVWNLNDTEWQVISKDMTAHMHERLQRIYDCMLFNDPLKGLDANRRRKLLVSESVNDRVAREMQIEDDRSRLLAEINDLKKQMLGGNPKVIANNKLEICLKEIQFERFFKDLEGLLRFHKSNTVEVLPEMFRLPAEQNKFISVEGNMLFVSSRLSENDCKKLFALREEINHYQAIIENPQEPYGKRQMCMMRLGWLHGERREVLCQVCLDHLDTKEHVIKQILSKLTWSKSSLMKLSGYPVDHVLVGYLQERITNLQLYLQVLHNVQRLENGIWVRKRYRRHSGDTTRRERVSYSKASGDNIFNTDHEPSMSELEQLAEMREPPPTKESEMLNTNEGESPAEKFEADASNRSKEPSISLKEDGISVTIDSGLIPAESDNETDGLTQTEGSLKIDDPPSPDGQLVIDEDMDRGDGPTKSSSTSKQSSPPDDMKSLAPHPAKKLDILSPEQKLIGKTAAGEVKVIPLEMQFSDSLIPEQKLIGEPAAREVKVIPLEMQFSDSRTEEEDVGDDDETRKNLRLSDTEITHDHDYRIENRNASIRQKSLPDNFTDQISTVLKALRKGVEEKQKESAMTSTDITAGRQNDYEDGNKIIAPEVSDSDIHSQENHGDVDLRQVINSSGNPHHDEDLRLVYCVDNNNILVESKPVDTNEVKVSSQSSRWDKPHRTVSTSSTKDLKVPSKSGNSGTIVEKRTVTITKKFPHSKQVSPRKPIRITMNKSPIRGKVASFLLSKAKSFRRTNTDENKIGSNLSAVRSIFDAEDATSDNSMVTENLRDVSSQSLMEPTNIDHVSHSRRFAYINEGRSIPTVPSTSNRTKNRYSYSSTQNQSGITNSNQFQMKWDQTIHNPISRNPAISTGINYQSETSNSLWSSRTMYNPTDQSTRGYLRQNFANLSHQEMVTALNNILGADQDLMTMLSDPTSASRLAGMLDDVEDRQIVMQIARKIQGQQRWCYH